MLTPSFVERTEPMVETASDTGKRRVKTDEELRKLNDYELLEEYLRNDEREAPNWGNRSDKVFIAEMFRRLLERKADKLE
jgi:hypothetical protein